MRKPILDIDIRSSNNPASIIAGKPTAKIFSAGAALVITPRPILINNKEAIMGIPRSTAPMNIMELHWIINADRACISIIAAIGSSLKLSSKREITITCPPNPKNIRVEQTTRNCEITGTLPIFASIIFAMLKPIDVDIPWPPTISAALTICNIRPMVTPIKT